MFDSQADVAALVYGPRDEPDRLLRAFTNDLREWGYQPAGIIQLDHRQPWEDAGVRLATLPDGEIIQLAHDFGTPTCGCRPDAHQLSAARKKLSAAIADGADLVVINRFGRLEAGGQGFADEIRDAVAADIPVLITVPEMRFNTWTHFSRGMGVKLPCSRAPLDRWWIGVSSGMKRSTHPRAALLAATYCELAK
jgi:nucleoside-triphosphatase THEP1